MAKLVKNFPRQSKLAGKLRQHDITYEEIAKAVGMSIPGIEAIVNGRVDYKLSIARKFKVYISKKAREDIQLSDIIE